MQSKVNSKQFNESNQKFQNLLVDLKNIVDGSRERSISKIIELYKTVSKHHHHSVSPEESKVIEKLEGLRAKAVIFGTKIENMASKLREIRKNKSNLSDSALKEKLTGQKLLELAKEKENTNQSSVTDTPLMKNNNININNNERSSHFGESTPGAAITPFPIQSPQLSVDNSFSTSFAFSPLTLGPPVHLTNKLSASSTPNK